MAEATIDHALIAARTPQQERLAAAKARLPKDFDEDIRSVRISDKDVPPIPKAPGILSEAREAVGENWQSFRRLIGRRFGGRNIKKEKEPAITQAPPEAPEPYESTALVTDVLAKGNLPPEEVKRRLGSLPRDLHPKPAGESSTTP
jgi:hypothetical protein